MIKNEILNKEWLNFCKENLILGFLLYLLATLFKVNEWFFHGIYCFFSTYIIFKLFYKYRKENLYFYISDVRFIFILSYFMSYVFGSSILIIGSEIQITTKMDELQVDANESIYVDSLNCIGLAIATYIGSAYHPKILAKKVSIICGKLKKLNITFFIYFSLITGIIISLYVAYFDISNNDEVLPGVFRQSKYLLYTGSFIGILFQKKSYPLLIISISSCLIASLIGLATFNKGEFILPIMILLVAFSIKYNSKIIFLNAIIIMFSLLTIVGGGILYARYNIEGIDKYSLSDRINILGEGITTESSVNDYAKYNAWGRLTLLNAQVGAVRFYNQGDGGGDTKLLFWALVPRIIYPNKPILSNTGGELYTKLTGNIGSSTAQGVFINGYYNEGLFGLLIYSAICGFIISQLTSVSRVIAREKSLGAYPILLFCILICSNTPGILSTDFLGLFATLVVIIYLYNILIDLWG